MRKPSVTGYEGKHDQLIENGDGGTVVWQPGDGTRYVLTVRPVTNPEEAKVLGCQPGDLLATVGTRAGLVTLLLDSGGLYHESYVAEKLAMHGIKDLGGVLPVVALLNLTIGDEQYGIDAYKLYRKLRKA